MSIPHDEVSWIRIRWSSSLIFPALTVGGFQSQRPDDIPQRRAGEVDDLAVDIVHVVLRTFDAFFVRFHSIIDLCIDHCVQVIVRDDLLRFSVDHLFGRVDLVHVVDDRDDPMETGRGELLIFAQPFDKAPVGRANDADADEEDCDQSNYDDDRCSERVCVFHDRVLR